MSNITKKIYDSLCIIYSNKMQTLTEISMNTSAGKKFVISSHIALNYDFVLNHPKHYKKTNEKSPDVLFYYKNKLYFIEFKDCENPQKNDLRGKIHEGIATLYHFANKYLNISKNEFIDIDINYLVFIRKQRNAVTAALNKNSARYNLKNLEGYILRSAEVINDPNILLKILKRITNQAIQQIDICDSNGKITTYS